MNSKLSSIVYDKVGNVLLQTLGGKRTDSSKACGRLESRGPLVILLWQCKRRGSTERLDGAQIDESHTHTATSQSDS